MLRIRSEQMYALRANAESGFVEQMLAYLATTYPKHHALLGDDGTRARVRAGLAAAGRYRIETQSAIVILVELMVEFGERLERSPESAWAERMLARDDAPSEVRVAAVREYLAKSTGGRLLVVTQL